MDEGKEVYGLSICFGVLLCGPFFSLTSELILVFKLLPLLSKKERKKRIGFMKEDGKHKKEKGK